MRRQKLLGAGFGLGVGLVALASAAWGCTAQLGMHVKPGGALPGAAVTVEGDGAGGPVDIRWNDVNGPVIGQAADGTRFAIGVRVPEVEPGVYTVLAVSREAGVEPARVPFVVRGAGSPAATGVSGDLWSGYASAEGVRSASAPSSGGPDRLALGMALLGGGLVALSTGLAVVEVRRRKAMAR